MKRQLVQSDTLGGKKAKTTHPILTDLPFELLVQIFEENGSDDWRSLSSVSKSLHQTCLRFPDGMARKLMADLREFCQKYQVSSRKQFNIRNHTIQLTRELFLDATKEVKIECYKEDTEKLVRALKARLTALELKNFEPIISRIVRYSLSSQSPLTRTIKLILTGIGMVNLTVSDFQDGCRVKGSIDVPDNLRELEIEETDWEDFLQELAMEKLSRRPKYLIGLDYTSSEDSSYSYSTTDSSNESDFSESHEEKTDQGSSE